MLTCFKIPSVFRFSLLSQKIGIFDGWTLAMWALRCLKSLVPILQYTQWYSPIRWHLSRWLWSVLLEVISPQVIHLAFKFASCLVKWSKNVFILKIIPRQKTQTIGLTFCSRLFFRNSMSSGFSRRVLILGHSMMPLSFSLWNMFWCVRTLKSVHER